MARTQAYVGFFQAGIPGLELRLALGVHAPHGRVSELPVVETTKSFDHCLHMVSACDGRTDGTGFMGVSLLCQFATWTFRYYLRRFATWMVRYLHGALPGRFATWSIPPWTFSHLYAIL